MKALNILLVVVLFSFLPSVYADESDLVEQLAKQAKPIIERREKHGGRVQELKLQLEGLAKDKQASLTNIAVLNKEEPILDKAWELLKMEDYETAPVLNKVWEKLEIGEFESDKDFLARKETARVKAQKEFDLVYGEWKSQKATDKRVSDFEKKKASLKGKLTKEYDEAIAGWKSKVVAEDKKLKQIEKSSKLATSDLTEEINKLSTLQDVATFTLIYGAKQVSLPKFNREKMAFEIDLSTEITEGKYGLIQSKKTKELYVKIDELSKHKTKQYEVKFKTLEEAKSFKELFESNKVSLEQKFSLRLANIPSSSPAYFEPAFYKAAVKEPDVNIPGSYTQGTRSTTAVVGTNIFIFLAGSIFGSDPQRMNEAMQSNNASQTVFSPGRTIPGRTIPAVNIPEIKVAGVSYNFAVAECKVAILNSTGGGAVSGEVALVASISNPSKSKDPTQSINTTEMKPDLTKIAAAIEKEMILIPAGKFMMGSPATEKGRSDNETQHEVTLTKSFYMGKYEVTQEQWEAVMGYNPDDTKGSKLPVTDVSWEGCQEFIKKLNAKSNGGYRLPTEAEWEYACRAGTTTAYSFGDTITPEDVNNDTPKINKHKDEDGKMIVVKTHKPNSVGAYKPNAFGLYDMHGNVCEWCEDWYGDYPAGSVMDPKGPLKGEKHVVRGGGFSESIQSSDDEFSVDRRFFPGMSSTRFGLNKSVPYVIGLRLVKTK